MPPVGANTVSQKVVVAMSGGVDSSVAAALLKQQGYSVTGMMLRLWSEPGRETANRCCTPAAMALARQVAAQLDIPFYTIDAKDTFSQQIVSFFVSEYGRGVTPNPCLMCNRHIRWEFLLNRALSIGADYMATGHYARIQHPQDAPARLFRGIDPDKDQSYVLHALDHQQLDRALFPLGDLTKTEVRQIAKDFDLPVSTVKDSQDLCFLAGTTYTEFLERNAPLLLQPGPIVNINGEPLGEHQGLPRYTIGQRKGLNLASPIPLYVLDKLPETNTLVVGEKQGLGTSTAIAGEMNWINRPHAESFRALVQTRYTGKAQAATVTEVTSERIQIKFDNPVYDLTPGQAAVVYIEDELVGGGILETNSLLAPQRKPVQLVTSA